MTADEIRQRLEAMGWVRNDVIHGSERWCGPDNRTFIYIYEDGAMRCGGGGDLNIIAHLLTPAPVARVIEDLREAIIRFGQRSAILQGGISDEWPAYLDEGLLEALKNSPRPRVSATPAPADVPDDMWADLAKALDNSANDSRRFGEQANAEDKRGWQQWETAYRWLAGVAKAQQAPVPQPDMVAVPRDFAEWAHGLMERRLRPWVGKFSVDPDREERDRRWLTALAAALERRPNP